MDTNCCIEVLNFFLFSSQCTITKVVNVAPLKQLGIATDLTEIAMTIVVAASTTHYAYSVAT